MWRLERVTRYETEHAASAIETAQSDVEDHRRGEASYSFGSAILAEGITREQMVEGLELAVGAVRAFTKLREAGDDETISNDDAAAILYAVGNDEDNPDVEPARKGRPGPNEACSTPFHTPRRRRQRSRWRRSFTPRPRPTRPPRCSATSTPR